MKNTLIVLVIVATAGIGYFAFVKKSGLVTYQTPTPTTTPIKTATLTTDPVVDLKTYTNSQYGIVFKYPKSLTVENYSSPRTSAQFSDIVYFGFEGRPGSPGALYAAASSDLAKQNIYADAYKTIATSSTKIAGYDVMIETVQATNPNNKDDVQKVAFIKYGKVTFVLMMSKIYESDFDRILNSWSFK